MKKPVLIFLILSLYSIPVLSFGITIFDAAENGNIVFIKSYIKKGGDLKVKDSMGRTALIIAAEKSRAEAVGLLLEANADVNAEDMNGSTPLIRASVNKESGILKQLLNAGADINHRDIGRNTALNWAAEFNPENAVILIDAKADVNAANFRNETALITAVKMGYKDLALHLIQAGANVNPADINGETALMKAAEGGFPDIVKILIDAKADINGGKENGDTALMIAVENGSVETVKTFIDAGADVKKADKWGFTALTMAKSYYVEKNYHKIKIDSFNKIEYKDNEDKMVVNFLVKGKPDTKFIIMKLNLIKLTDRNGNVYTPESKDISYISLNFYPGKNTQMLNLEFIVPKDFVPYSVLFYDFPELFFDGNTQIIDLLNKAGA